MTYRRHFEWRWFLLATAKHFAIIIAALSAIGIVLGYVLGIAAAFQNGHPWIAFLLMLPPLVALSASFAWDQR